MKKLVSMFIPIFLVIMALSSEPQDELKYESQAAGWKPIGPGGGEIQGLALNRQKNEIYAVVAGFPGQVFRSTDSGGSWERIALLPDYLFDVAFDPLHPDTVFILGKTEIFKSTDRGSTWKKYSFAGDYSAESGQIAINPKTPNVLYIACKRFNNSRTQDFQSVSKSTDGGKSWVYTNLPPAFSGMKTCCISVSPANPELIYVGGDYDTTSKNHRIFKSTDGGRNWIDVSGSLSSEPKAIVTHPFDSFKVYVATGNGIYRSSDGGHNWEKNSGKAYGTALAFNSSNPRTLYAGADKKIYKSVDGGINWTESSDGIYGFCKNLLISSNLIFLGSTAGIFKSIDGSLTWKNSFKGIVATQILSISVAPSKPNIVYAGIKGNGFFKSANSGRTWERTTSFYRSESVTRIAVDPQNPNKIFVLTFG
jgi:photosystem II stability/assembly factor-like uncharacterized protein